MNLVTRYLRTSFLRFINVVHDRLVEDEVAGSSKETLLGSSGFNAYVEISWTGQRGQDLREW